MTSRARSIPDHCLARLGATAPIDAPLVPVHYARMFPSLPAFRAEEQFLRALGRIGGVCDCEDTDDTPESLAESAAGWPIFGQFVAHDITADRSHLRSETDTAGLINARSPKLDLECLYGDGPTGHPYLFQRDDPAKFRLGKDDSDLQRNADETAIIGDPRNDSHQLISQFHLAMLKAHNAFVDEAREQGIEEAFVFDEASRQLRWHYQWIILHEFLPSLVGEQVAADALQEGSRYFHPGDHVFLPLEFADAAYRYGHAQIRHRYQLNAHSGLLPLFPDLLGFRPVPREHLIDWSMFFDTVGAPAAQRAKKMDGRLVRSLLQLPLAITGECEIEDYQSLAVRDLQRGQGVGLPSGEAVARYIGVSPLDAEQIGLTAIDWHEETPLWYYILREAAVLEDGQRLGPVGARIVTDVFLGLIDADRKSFRHSEEEWRPRKTLSDLLVRS
ncbi:peroxidase family protein [Terriglobus roseus]|uniref:peroxidase family protein n=1 Tax=Terriglobus roseus TaxID=392734 RepID=UPI0015607974|nr:peroxidase family protein [Terriglobus roseus]